MHWVNLDHLFERLVLVFQLLLQVSQLGPFFLQSNPCSLTLLSQPSLLGVPFLMHPVNLAEQSCWDLCFLSLSQPSLLCIPILMHPVTVANHSFETSFSS